jgi:hypothetical protein
VHDQLVDQDLAAGPGAVVGAHALSSSSLHRNIPLQYSTA